MVFRTKEVTRSFGGRSQRVSRCSREQQSKHVQCMDASTAFIGLGIACVMRRFMSFDMPWQV
jgi:hypothetical protein